MMAERFTITKHHDGSVSVNMSEGDAKKIVHAIGYAAVYKHLKSNNGHFFSDMSGELDYALSSNGIDSEDEEEDGS